MKHSKHRLDGFIFFFFLSPKKFGNAFSPFAKWTKTELVLCNGVVRRIIELPAVDGRFLTLTYKPANGEYDSLSDTLTDFQFEVDHVIYSGRRKWTLLSIKIITGDNEGSGAAVDPISQNMKVE